MADFQQNFLASLGAGYNFGQQIKQQQDTSKLNQLASQAYGAAPEQRDALLSQMAGVDAGSAFQAEKQMAYSDERRNTTMVNMARMLTGAPEQARAGIYRQMVPTLSRFGMSELPQEYNAQTAPIIDKAAQSIMSALNGGKVNNPYDGLPADIQSLRMLQESPELATLDRERRQASGMVPKLVETSDGYGWGTPGGGIQLAPLEGVAGHEAPAQPQTQAPQLFAALGQKYGIRPTSVQRTPERNKEVGGVANSYHLTGQAADWAVPQQFKTQFMADARANGFEAIDEGDHIHIEPASRGVSGGGIAQPYQAPQREQAPSGYRATAGGGLEAIPGGPADKPEAAPKPMPASILRLQRASREALSVSQGLGSSIAKVRQQLKDGDIKLGPLQNLAYQGMNAAGQSTKESRNYQGMRSTFEKMRNDSLRLNSGVQTEGDAQRAWAELLGNLNDAANVDQQLGRIEEINDRAIQLHTENMDEIEAEYGGRNAPGRSASPAFDASDFSNLWN